MKDSRQSFCPLQTLKIFSISLVTKRSIKSKSVAGEVGRGWEQVQHTHLRELAKYESRLKLRLSYSFFKGVVRYTSSERRLPWLYVLYYARRPGKYLG